MKKIITYLLISLLTGFSTLSFSQVKSGTSMIESTTVKNLDLQKFLGTWYEIARFPHNFEKNLQGVTATYSMRNDGKIKVVNQGYLGSPDGKHKSATGKARIPNPDDPARLQVSFFLFFYGDYLILELDENYQWAMIGTGSPDYFWILSRKPELDDQVLKKLYESAEKRGYDLSKIEMVKHKK